MKNLKLTTLNTLHVVRLNKLLTTFILEGSALSFQYKTCLLLRETGEEDANW